jgi:hypothetical protein
MLLVAFQTPVTVEEILTSNPRVHPHAGWNGAPGTG